ncbi:sensor histidine kinase [Camelliibacillus cellulosilyticus]|uniref:histidine kinase n=1 Tax=Camelliibacillus cellulosilyticus TaxID=2174486 RepID=A0ABV9GPY7_9BACL
MSLKTKLIIFFVLIAVTPLSVLGYFTYQKTTEILSEQVSEGMLNRLGQVNRNLLFFLNDIDQMTNYISLNKDVQDVLMRSKNRSPLDKYRDNQNIQSLFDTVKGSKNWDINIYIIGFNGDRYFTGKYLPRGYDDYMENWGIFRKARQANGSLAWDTQYSLIKFTNQDVVLSAARVIKNPETNQPLAYLIVDIMEPAIADIYQTEDTKKDSQLFLLDHQGYIISSYPNKATVGTRLNHLALENVLSSDKGYMRTTWQKEPVMMVYDTVDNGKFKSVSFIPIKEITRQNVLIKWMTILLALMGLIIALWLSYFLSGSIIKPIKKLIKLMKKVEHGDLTVVSEMKYKDEIGVLGNSFNHMIRRLRFFVQDSIEKQTLIKESEIKALRAQINPHFLYNTLETIRWITQLNGLKSASNMVVALGEMLRYSLKSGQRLVPLTEEMTHLKHYIYIQQTRFQDKFAVSYEIAVEADRIMVPSLILQPLVENAMTHGLEMKMEKGHLEVIIKKIGNHLIITVADDGMGIDEQTLQTLLTDHRSKDDKTDTGIGLKNVHQRIQMVFGEGYGLKIESQKQVGTKVKIVLPVVEKGGERANV